MNEHSVLYLFTGKYPYGLTIEGYLELELLYLSKRFSKIVIVPTRGENYIREVPKNCEVLPPVFPSKFEFLLRGLYSRRAFCFIWKDFIKHGVFLSWKKMGVWIKGSLVTNNLINSKTIKKIEGNLHSNDVCYYYWGKWSNVLSYFWKKKCHNVSRFHGGWDLWEEDYGNYAPFRSTIANSLDEAFLISDLGYGYFSKKYKGVESSLARLGTADFGCKRDIGDSVIRLLSCSSIYPIKRVPLILTSVITYAKQNPNKQIVWAHLGGGEGYKSIKKAAESVKEKNLTIKLPGQMKHDEVLQYYKKYNPDVYINLSTTEGVPVAIMEAISFNVPIVATNVGSTCDIVNEKTGLLISSNPDMEEVARAIDTVMEKKLSPRQFWEDSFSAEKNYGKFASRLVEISNMPLIK